MATHMPSGVRRSSGATAARQILALFGAALVAACSSLAPIPPAQPIRAPEAGVGHVWQRVRFYVHWPKGEEPHWYVDALLAHRVVGPALARHRSEIELWRFHRRANRDSAGHSLSFLSFAPPAVNAELCAELRSDPLVQRLLQAGVLDKLVCTGPPPGKAGQIDATSDPHWTPELQRAWPYFIMGVSETWLELIDEYAREAGPEEPANVKQALERYREIEDRVSNTWTEEGGHAFLHHLDALFGYEPVYVRERHLQSF